MDRPVAVPLETSNPGRINLADILLLVTAIIWGVNFSIVKFALAEIPPIAFVGLRFFVASAALLALGRALGQSFEFESRHLPALIGLGLLGNTAYQLLFIFGLSLTTAENSSLILATSPAWVALIGTVIGAEKVEPVGWLGIALSLAGIILIIAGSDRLADFPFGGPSLRGDILLLSATLCWSLYTILVRPMTRRYSSVSVTAFTTTAGTIPLIGVGIPAMIHLPWTEIKAAAWMALVFSGILAIGLAYIIWNYGVSKLGSTRTSIYSNLSLPSALLTAWLWLEEVLMPLQWWGTVLAMGGVLLARSFTHHKKG